MKLTIITGMSGAGKSQVIRYMEDLGYYCVDNMPPMLLPKFIELWDQSNSKMDKVAVVLDVRGGVFFEALLENLEKVEEEGYKYEILFLDASDEELIRRFKETRRVHPLSLEEGKQQKFYSLEEGIKEERSRLSTVKKMAKNILDTTGLSVKTLKDELRGIYLEGEEGRNLTISMNSFGFKYGIPLDSDLLFDVRFMPNPFYVPELKELTGEEDIVQEYVMKGETSKEFYEKLKELVAFLLPQYVQEGKNHLVISIGCTGGKHRSVTIVNRLKKDFEDKSYRVIVNHRDKDKTHKG